MKHSIYAKYKNVMLRPVTPDDIENLRCWRNDPNNAKYLRPIGIITPEMQLVWYEEDLKNVNIYTFAVEETEGIKQIVGSVALYDFQDDYVESGSLMLGNKNARGIVPTIIKLVLHIAFTHFKCARVYASVNTKNIPSVMTNIKVGFEKIGKFESAWGDEGYDLVMTKEKFYYSYPEVCTVQIHTDWGSNVEKKL